MGVLQFGIPNIRQIEHEPGHGSFAHKFVGSNQLFDWQTWTVDVRGSGVRVYQPPESRSILYPFAHLLLNFRQSIGWRDELDYEVRTDRWKSALLFTGQQSEAG